MNDLTKVLRKLAMLEELALDTARHLASTGIPSQVAQENYWDTHSSPDAESALRKYQQERDRLRKTELEVYEAEVLAYLDNSIEFDTDPEYNCGFVPSVVEKANLLDLKKKVERLEKTLKKVREENKKLKKKDK